MKFLIPIWKDTTVHRLEREALGGFIISADDYVWTEEIDLNMIGLDTKRDLRLIRFWNTGDIDVPNFTTKAHQSISARIPKNANMFVPKIKHLELARHVFDFYHDQICTNECDAWLMDIMEWKDYWESSKIFINKEVAQKYFSVNTDWIYSNYNFLTSTNRPSNSWNHINLAALNKDNGSREMIISRYDDGRLVEFDFDSYHIRLIADILGYELPEDPHAAFSMYYYGTESRRDEAKHLTFRQIYGGVETQYATHDFFMKIENFKKLIWEQLLDEGYVYTPLYKRPIFKSKTMNINKLFNYYLQALETEMNMIFMKKLKEFNAVPVLYTYDSFLFDIQSDAEIDSIRTMFTFPVHVKIGTNYNDLRHIY